MCMMILVSVISSFGKLCQVETEHYYVVFKGGDEYWAHKVIKIAEDIWDDLAVTYEIIPDYSKVTIYIEDSGDYANGAAYVGHNAVHIYTTHNNWRSRGSDRWIRNVLAHELAHIFTCKAASKDGFFRYFHIDRLSYYDNPDVNVSVWWTDLLAPMWWIEGVAQYESTENKGDQWDNYRDMFLRMATLEDDLLDYVQMSSFENRNGFYPEMTYNQGFALMMYIDSVYGREATKKIGTTKAWPHFNIAMRKATGKSGQALYREWKGYLQDKYGAVAESIKENLITGKKIFDEGYMDINGIRSPDGRYIALLSNRGYDVGYTNLYVLDTKTDKLYKVLKRGTVRKPYNEPTLGYERPSRKFTALKRNHYNGPLSILGTEQADEPYGITPVVSSRVQWFPDSKKLYYSRYTDRSGSKMDIYTYDLEAEKEKQITWQARALEPALSPDGKTFAYIHNAGGVQNLALVDVDGRNTRFLTNFNNGTQMYSPCWTKDGKHIIMGIMFEENRDIAIVNADAEPFDRFKKVSDSTFFADSLNFQDDLGLKLLIATDADERDPFISPDGRYLYFSSDRTGIFNIYRMDLETKKVEQITNVLGGAFAPSVDADGKRLLYTGFSAANFSIYEMAVETPRRVELDSAAQRDFSARFDSPFVFSSDPQNGQYRLGEYKPKFHLWEFVPYISFQPTYITDTVGISNFRLGFRALTGELRGNLNMAGSAYLAKDFKDRAGPSWGGFLATRVNVPALEGENITLRPYFEAFGEHHNTRSEITLADYSMDDFTGELPNVGYAWTTDMMLNGQYTQFYEIPLFGDSLYAGAFLDDPSGSFRYDRKFTYYGISGFMELNEHHTIGLQFLRSRDYINGSIFDGGTRLQKRVFKMEIKNDTIFDTPVDINSDNDFDSLVNLFTDNNLIDDTTFPGKLDIIDLYDGFELYKDHMLALQYQFLNVKPSFSIPSRVDNIFINLLFFNSTYTIDYAFPGKDSLITVDTTGEDKEIYINLDQNGNQIPFYSSIKENKDYLGLNIGWLERFPLPGNNLLTRPPKGLGMRHFVTTNIFLGSLNRQLSEYAFNYPLKYRASHFLRAYPYSFNPIDTVTRATMVDVYEYDQFLVGSVTTATYLSKGDAVDDDILDGNGIIYYDIEYTLELFQGLTVPGPGITVNGLYITPFFEMANLWNRDWKNFNGWDLLPMTKDKKWDESYLRDFGLRVDLQFMFLDSWHGLFSFTWARRLDLDDEILDIKKNGDIVHLDKDRFIFTIQVY